MDSQPVKQEENRIGNNRHGVGGFQDHPELINRSGRPKTGFSWRDILEQTAEEIDKSSCLTFRRKVATKLWELAMNGNVQAMKELFNRMDGFPRFISDLGKQIDGITVEIIENKNQLELK